MYKCLWLDRHKNVIDVFEIRKQPTNHTFHNRGLYRKHRIAEDVTVNDRQNIVLACC
jgi:hypothetical protein